MQHKKEPNLIIPPHCLTDLDHIADQGIDDVNILRQKDHHTVYRIFSSDRSYVLKCFTSPPPIKEILVYTLLQENNIPTLPVYDITQAAILLEDLNANHEWRSATDDDMSSQETGKAVSRWYRTLHDVGFEILSRKKQDIHFLQPWIECITLDSMIFAGNYLEFAGAPAWNLALDHFETLKSRYREFPQTFNYADFAAVNLALSDDRDENRKAIVFDYDQFSIGTAFSDWRNVTWSLKGAARVAFIDTYGPVSDEEMRVDDVLSILEGLIVASQREIFPSWANPLRKSVTNGELESAISAAL